MTAGSGPFIDEAGLGQEDVRGGDALFGEFVPEDCKLLEVIEADIVVRGERCGK